MLIKAGEKGGHKGRQTFPTVRLPMAKAMVTSFNIAKLEGRRIRVTLPQCRNDVIMRSCPSHALHVGMTIGSGEGLWDGMTSLLTIYHGCLEGSRRAPRLGFS